MSTNNDSHIVSNKSFESNISSDVNDDSFESNISEDITKTNNKDDDDDDDESLIQFFDNVSVDSSTNTSYVGTFKKSKISSDEINAAYQMLICQQSLSYETLKQRSLKDDKAGIIAKNDYKPSAGDIIVSKDGRKHQMNFVQNSVVKQCSMYAFEEMCEGMSNILQDISRTSYITQKAFRKFKVDINLAARLLQSTKNMAHGMFLGDGGAYSKRLYHRKELETNAKETLVKARSVKVDGNIAQKKNQ